MGLENLVTASGYPKTRLLNLVDITVYFEIIYKRTSIIAMVIFQ